MTIETALFVIIMLILIPWIVQGVIIVFAIAASILAGIMVVIVSIYDAIFKSSNRKI